MNDTKIEGRFGDLAALVHAQALADIREVTLQRVGGNPELIGDLRKRAASAQRLRALRSGDP